MQDRSRIVSQHNSGIASHNMRGTTRRTLHLVLVWCLEDFRSTSDEDKRLSKKGTFGDIEKTYDFHAVHRSRQDFLTSLISCSGSLRNAS